MLPDTPNPGALLGSYGKIVFPLGCLQPGGYSLKPFRELVMYWRANAQILSPIWMIVFARREI